MVKLSSRRLVVAIGGLALWLTTGFGVASAEPDPLIDTTCSYSQFVAALNAKAPDLAKAFSEQPEAQSILQRFVDSPVDQRRQIVAQGAGTELGPKLAGAIQQAARICNDY